MINNFPCKCGHVVDEHKKDHDFPLACWHVRRDRYGAFVCPCINFDELNNLEYLEKCYENNNSGK